MCTLACRPTLRQKCTVSTIVDKGRVVLSGRMIDAHGSRSSHTPRRPSPFGRVRAPPAPAFTVGPSFLQVGAVEPN